MDSHRSKKVALSTDAASTSLREHVDSSSPSSSSAVSMHTLPEYDPNDDEISVDQLPAYTDVEQGPESTTRPSALIDQTPGERLVALTYLVPGSRPVRYRAHRFNNPFNRNRGTAEKCLHVTFTPEFSSDASALNMLVIKQAKLPPEPFIHIKGTHTRSTRDPQGKESKETVTDFDFYVEGRDTIIHGEHENLFRDSNPTGANPPYWRRLCLPGTEEKAYRGTRVKSRALPFKGAGDSSNDNPTVPGLSDPTNQRSALQYWCDRFTTDPATLKSFTFERRLEGFDAVRVENAVSSHIRSLNYRGSIAVETHINNAGFTVYSPHWINRLRINNFVWYLVVILQLWILTWPVIWLMEKRYEVVKCRWYFAMKGGGIVELAKGYDEEGWVRLWGRAIKRAAETRTRNGEYLIKEDIDLAEQPEMIGEEEVARRERVRSGQGGWMDSAVGLMRSASEVHREYNRAAGWGADE